VQATVWVGSGLMTLAFLPVLFSRVRGIRTIPTEEPAAG
jgi:hypothetical protein